MKKQLSTAMAAAMAFGAVVPTFANEVETFELTQNEDVNVRLASGFASVEPKTRGEIFNYNGKPSDREAHTLKSGYTKDQIIVEKFGATPAEDLFLIGTKSTDNVAITTEKAKMTALEKEIEEYVKDGYTKNEQIVKATLTVTGGIPAYTTGSKVVTLTKDVNGTGGVESTFPETIEITFANIDKVELTETNPTDVQLTNKLRLEVFKVADADATHDFEATPDYRTLNELKYTIESNLSKFDVVVDETTETTTNDSLEVKLYRKGATKNADNLVATFNFNHVASVDKKEIMNIPVNNDFASHWASNEILAAMLDGQVDATGTYRPQDSITRAEFAKIVATVIAGENEKDLEEAYKNGEIKETFHDVTSDKWYAPVVAYLQEEGIVVGDGEKFNPESNITRQEVALMVTRALDKSKADENHMIDVNGTKVDKDVITKFKDDKAIDAWADNAVKFLNEDAKYDADGKGTMKPVVEGDNNMFNPKQNITRAEALVMAQRAAIASIPMAPVVPAPQ